MAVLIKGESLYVAWLGDSQVVLSKAGQPALLMNPHKPDREVLELSVVFYFCIDLKPGPNRNESFIDESSKSLRAQKSS